MAIINQESAFVDDARPPRKWFLGVIPLSHPTTAYGYCQALDGTWEQYLRSTGKTNAERDNFADAVDFIGWYTKRTRQELGVSQRDAYRQYLAYHEGQNGFRKKSYNAKPWLISVAKKVQRNAQKYSKQMDECQPALDGLLD